MQQIIFFFIDFKILKKKCDERILLEMHLQVCKNKIAELAGNPAGIRAWNAAFGKD